MHETWPEFLFVILQGLLAVGAALCAVAFRRGTRILTPAGFIMLALGMMLELMTPRPSAEFPWAIYVRATAIALMWCGLIRLAVESVEAWIRRHRVHISTFATESAVTVLYGATLLLVAARILSFDIRQLLALPVLFALAKGWMEHRDMLAGFLLQTQRPFRPGDWVRFGEQIGQVQETGWRSTRIRTRARENVTIPSDVMAQNILTNFSASGRVADEVFIGFGYEESPGTIENAALELLADIPEVLKEPHPEVGPWEFGDWSIRYRIKYWLADYGHQESVRMRINRSLWYVMQRHAISTPVPSTLMPEAYNGARNGSIPEEHIIAELRRVDLLKGLSDEDLRIVLPSIKVIKFGRDEVLIRQGDEGDCFFVLRRGVVDIIREGSNGDAPIVVNTIPHTAARNFFGEIALLTGQPRNTTVRAHRDVEVLRIDRNGFALLFKARPEIAARMAKIAAARVEDTTDQAEGAGSHGSATLAQESRMLQTMRRIFDF
jgi:small-conductance mechanosensitive channel/CRP-like cAMP-binding protein